MNELQVIEAPKNVSLQTVPMTASVHQTIDISVSGGDRESIAHGQQRLVEWCRGKLGELEGERAELEAAVEQARRSKWKISPLQNQVRRCVKRIEYYQKMLAAFMEGYILVPNFPLEIFAIRTGAKYPKEMASFNNWRSTTEQKAQTLTLGAGEYQNPDPVIFERMVDVPSKTPGINDKKKEYFANHWGDVDYPLTMAKPHLMEAVDHAMALKIFDEIGILPARRAKGDPVICGVIVDGSVARWQAKRATFMLAWHVDTRTL